MSLMPYLLDTGERQIPPPGSRTDQSAPPRRPASPGAPRRPSILLWSPASTATPWTFLLADAVAEHVGVEAAVGLRERLVRDVILPVTRTAMAISSGQSAIQLPRARITTYAQSAKQATPSRICTSTGAVRTVLQRRRNAPG